MRQKFLAVLIAVTFALSFSVTVNAQNEVNTSAQAYILLNGVSGETVSCSNENERLPMASTTKIMTAIITLEQDNLDEPFVVDANAIKIEGTSMGLIEGDTVTLRTLVYGMLLASGNDAANAAAVRISGSTQAFAQLMNEKAQKLGMNNTHFVTPSGLHDDNHYSTAYDMAVLANYALGNETFLQICSSEKAQLEYGNPPYTRWLTNHNKLLQYYDGVIGVKTGYTKKAGRCLVSAAKKDGLLLICVTLNDANDWTDHTSLLDYGFKNVEPVCLTEYLADVKINVVGGTADIVSTALSDELYGYVSQDSTQRLTKQIIAYPFLYAPIKKGDELGIINICLDGKVVASTSIVADDDIALFDKEKSDEKVLRSFWGKIKTYFCGLFK